MRKSTSLLPLIAIALVMAGCTTQTYVPPVTTPKAEVTPPKEEQPVEPRIEKPKPGRSAAVDQLLSQANGLLQQGQPGPALATLERALRISPSDAGIYYQMALAHVDMGQPEQAKQLARRGLSLARDAATRQQLQNLLSQL